jgi:mono/diheme cytochrome c family protein
MRLLYGCILTLLFVASAFAQQTTIKKVPAPETSAASGKEMYLAYCASCHGKDGKGTGPAASALKVPTPDLTTLSQRNQGKFPEMRVFQVIRGTDMPAHGSKDMPVWGPVFLTMSERHSSEVQLRVANLTKYLESIQVK